MMNALAQLVLALAAQVSETTIQCVSQPESGPHISVAIESSIWHGDAGLFGYRWRLASGSISKRSVRSVSVVDASSNVETPDGWRSFPPSSSAGRPVAVIAAAADDDRYDVKPGGELVLQTRSSNYPSVTIARVYPRRDMPCVPTTESEEKALASAGWTDEKLRRLLLVDFWTERLVVIAPLIPAQEKATREALFLTAIERLRAIRAYLTQEPSTSNPASAPALPKTLRQTQDSLDELRADALRTITGSEDHAIIDLLYSFYSGLNARGDQ